MVGVMVLGKREYFDSRELSCEGVFPWHIKYLYTDLWCWEEWGILIQDSH